MPLNPKTVLEDLGFEPDSPERSAPTTSSSAAKQAVSEVARRLGLPVSSKTARAKNRPHHDFGFERLRIWDRVVISKVRFQAREHFSHVKAYSATDKVPGKMNVPALIYKRGSDGWLVVTSLEEFLKIAKLADATLATIAAMRSGEEAAEKT